MKWKYYYSWYLEGTQAPHGILIKEPYITHILTYITEIRRDNAFFSFSSKNLHFCKEIATYVYFPFAY